MKKIVNKITHFLNILLSSKFWHSIELRFKQIIPPKLSSASFRSVTKQSNSMYIPFAYFGGVNIYPYQKQATKGCMPHWASHEP